MRGSELSTKYPGSHAKQFVFVVHLAQNDTQSFYQNIINSKYLCKDHFQKNDELDMDLDIQEVKHLCIMNKE